MAKKTKPWPTVWRTCDCGLRHEIEDWRVGTDEEERCSSCLERAHVEFILRLREMRSVEDKRWKREKEAP